MLGTYVKTVGVRLLGGATSFLGFGAWALVDLDMTKGNRPLGEAVLNNFVFVVAFLVLAVVSSIVLVRGSVLVRMAYSIGVIAVPAILFGLGSVLEGITLGFASLMAAVVAVFVPLSLPGRSPVGADPAGQV